MLDLEKNTLVLSYIKCLLRTLKLFPSDSLQQSRELSLSSRRKLPEKQDRSSFSESSSAKTEDDK